MMKLIFRFITIDGQQNFPIVFLDRLTVMSWNVGSSVMNAIPTFTVLLLSAWSGLQVRVRMASQISLAERPIVCPIAC
ncbi:hypothetical protein [Gemmobacter aquaticus]|uniref:hypothetical protein n=1 Tax=Gemmobacter aquaticus TaxID=490185 RepID=UPI00131505E1|nr:hypothetical protein [Gemmobacter aquaticus]